MTVPTELRTRRLRLRAWRPDDAAMLLPLLEVNQPHLGPWIPARVAAPAPLPELTARLAAFAHDFLDGREWRYGLFTSDMDDVLGEVALFPRVGEARGPIAEADHIEIGYWLRRDATGQGLATEAARAALDVAAGLPGLHRVEIRCDARNEASAAIPRRLGFALARTIPQPAVVPGEPPVELQVWTLPLPLVLAPGG